MPQRRPLENAPIPRDTIIHFFMTRCRDDEAARLALAARAAGHCAEHGRCSSPHIIHTADARAARFLPEEAPKLRISAMLSFMLSAAPAAPQQSPITRSAPMASPRSSRLLARAPTRCRQPGALLGLHGTQASLSRARMLPQSSLEGEFLGLQVMMHEAKEARHYHWRMPARNTQEEPRKQFADSYY